MREELAGIVRGVRRALEREAASGTGELLVGAVPKARRPAPPAPAEAPPAAAGRPARDEHRAESRTAPPASARAVALPTGAEVDLFGNPTPRPTPEAPPPPEPARAAGLAPAGIAGRAEILGRSLPVLRQIAEEVGACRRCGLCEARTHAVPGVGSAASGIVFVGEAPGAEEDRRGEPFVGRAGELLTRIIQAMDEAHLVPGVSLSRESVYICNVLKCRPPDNRNPEPDEVATCSPFLRRQLATIKPKIICCLGTFAAQNVLQTAAPISRLR